MSQMRDDYWEAKTVSMAPSHLTVSTEELEIQNSNLVATVISTAAKILSETPSIDKGRRVLEVGVGRGDLAVQLLPIVHQARHTYFGIDSYPKMLNVTRRRLREAGVGDELAKNVLHGEAANLTRGRESPFPTHAFRLVIWGKLGEHLVRDAESENSEWKQALDQVKDVLAPNGYFLLYEPLQEFNEPYRQKPRKHEKTLIRALKEYEDALRPMSLVSSRQWQFFDETYTIALWQKRGQ